MLDIGLPSLRWWWLTKAQTRAKCMSRSLSNTCNTHLRVLHRFAVLRDGDFFPMGLDNVLFPDTPRGVWVHHGFAIEHKKTADMILTEVERLMDKYSSTHVILVRLYYLNSLPSGRRTYIFRYYPHRSVTHLAERSRNLTHCS